MTAYSSQATGLAESIENIDRAGTYANRTRRDEAAVVYERVRDTAGALNEPPEQPRLHWHSGEQGLRMSWTPAASAR